MRGKVYPALIADSVPGSPPPMRGKDAQRALKCHCHRITPAYAGKSNPDAGTQHTSKDHPRLCGEKALYGRAATLGRGSPPPMRGKVSRKTCRSCHLRITPAYAGKSFIMAMEKNKVKGSPPPMRGKAETPDRKQAAERITPAYAGKSICIRH